MIDITKKINRKIISFYRYNKEKKDISLLKKKCFSIGSAHSKTILFWMAGGMDLLTEFESTIAFSLALRGAKVHAVLCDGILKGCMRREAADNLALSDWHKICISCKKSNEKILRKFDISFSYMSELVDKKSRSDIEEISKNATWENLNNLCSDINLVNIVRSSVVRYLKGGSLAGHEEIVPAYLFSALIVDLASKVILQRFSLHRMFMSHGIYVDWGPALNNAISQGVPVVSYSSGYIPFTFFFKTVKDMNLIDLYRINENDWEEYKVKNPLSLMQVEKLKIFMKNRYQSYICSDVKGFNEYSKNEIEFFKNKYQIQSGKSVWALMCHVNWDNSYSYSPLIYKDFNHWVMDSIERMLKVKDVTWLIKIHPAEQWNNPDTGIQRLIELKFPNLPSHIKVVKMDENVNPLSFYELIDGAITVCGTAGLELAIHGKPVILAGKAHYGEKGFTYDGTTQNSYRGFLDNIKEIKPLSLPQINLAKQYAYCHFIARQVPIPLFRGSQAGFFKFQADKINIMVPGSNQFYDFICNEILQDKGFIMDESLIKST